MADLAHNLIVFTETLTREGLVHPDPKARLKLLVQWALDFEPSKNTGSALSDEQLLALQQAYAIDQATLAGFARAAPAPSVFRDYLLEAPKAGVLEIDPAATVRPHAVGAGNPVGGALVQIWRHVSPYEIVGYLARRMRETVAERDGMDVDHVLSAAVFRATPAADATAIADEALHEALRAGPVAADDGGLVGQVTYLVAALGPEQAAERISAVIESIRATDNYSDDSAPRG